MRRRCAFTPPAGGEPHSPPAASTLVTARRWPARSDLRGQGTANAHQPTSSPRRRPCRLSPISTVHNDTATPTRPTSLDFCRQKRVSRQNAPRDTIHPAARRRSGVDKTDCARGGQQNRVGPLGPLGQHGRHGPLAKTSPFFTRPDGRAPRIARKTRLGRQAVAYQLNASLGVSPPTPNTETTSTFCPPKRNSRHNSPRDSNYPAVHRRLQRRRSQRRQTSG